MAKKKNTNWIQDLARDGYRWLCRDIYGKIWATKAKMNKKGTFADSSIWWEVELEKNEGWPSQFKGSVYYSIGE